MNATLRSLVPKLALSLACTAVLGACRATPEWGRPLEEGAPALLPLGWGDSFPDVSQDWEERDDLLASLDLSIQWTRRKSSEAFFPIAGITHARALASLERFRELLETSYGPEEFQRAVEDEFVAYKSAGWDGRGGGVLFTAYCTPILEGSLTHEPGYDSPLYALPPDLVKGPHGEVLGWETSLGRVSTYPSRGAIEAGALLAGRGLELVWLRDPIDAYIAHVNGSAFVRLTDGSMLRLGYAGKNGRTYRSLGKALEADGKIPRGQASLPAIRAWAANASPDELAEYLNRNESYVFFTPIEGNPHGSLDVEVSAGRSIATDKTLFPRGALVYVEADPEQARSGAPVNRIYLDQDTGGAIRTAGRADLYLGVGEEAEAVAGRTKIEGQLYYLFLE
ncbi:MAG TPA: murein transglycosylase [Planctomycetes bacterium]|nr:murein transglycosylase [Planctomycetota bacterium]